jgi:hypothetical protein
MHEAVFESGWDSAALIEHHRTEVAQAYQGRGRQVISLDWTLSGQWQRFDKYPHTFFACPERSYKE